MKMKAEIQEVFRMLSTSIVLLTLLFCGELFAQQRHEFNSGSNVSWTVPTGVTSIQVEVWGGGGRGGSRTSNGGGGGGGGGAYSRSVIAVTPGQQFYYTVGAGGNNTNNNGGDSWFSTSTNATTAVVLAKGGNGVANNTTTGASGGLASSGRGQFLFSGGSGAAATSGSSGNGGGGGSSAGTSTPGVNGTGSTGGIAPTGGGNGGNGRTGTQNAGFSGQDPGGGGGGARRTSSSTRNGGEGAAGRLVIQELVALESEFITPGTPVQWTVPAGVTRIQVETWGGGGRGGQRSNSGRGGGGGGGAYSRGTVSVTPGNIYFIQVGAGSTTTDAGGDSWFSAVNTPPSSDDFVLAKGGNSAQNNNNDGATGGQASGGYGNLNKYSGGSGANSSGSYTGGGGSSAGSEGNGNNGTAPTGGTGIAVGGGNGGNGHNNSNTVGNPGIAPGGGGSGARRSNSGSTSAGGRGADGQVRIKILDADIGVSTTPSSMTPNVGSNVNLTFTVRNYGPEAASGIVMTEVLPPGLAYVSHTSPSQGSYNTGNGTWTIGALANNASATLTLTVSVQPNSTYTNVATITATEFDSNKGNNTSTITLFPKIPTANLRITAEANNSIPIIGDQVIFTLNAYNSGPDDATNVIVSNKLPSGLTYQSHTGGTYDQGTGHWTIGSLAKNTGTTLTITASVEAIGDYDQEAVISGDQFDPMEDNNSSQLLIYPKHPAVNRKLDFSKSTYNLNNFTSDYTIDNLPEGAALSWHTSSDANLGNLYSGDLAAVPAGTYYLAFYDAAQDCYSLTIEVTIENNYSRLITNPMIRQRVK